MGNNVYVSAQVYYNVKGQRKEAFKTYTDLLDGFLTRYRKLLDLPGNIKFRICRIKGRGDGQWVNDCSLIELDVRAIKEMSDLAIILAHELVHAEQYHTGRLRDGDSGWIWKKGNGRVEATYTESFDYKRYMSFPWELEAYDRQGALARTAWNME